ncbi:hypothetical protein GCM10011344_24880 [Dokdonia pacifica]|uniref:Uncharacterized protein n=1 Tax=Dokdonia pacifica TaxID=1627892 RepID=A0A238WQY3_9FLAO|nr:hypothetical protein [Dokdonia pacifica]GGG23167.1 hypothetical protein GCM10011344_24880 [Dokdonia pacifica]SNR48664.1 hypothetical protein SAMN06265376_1011318 [Dokdonia pacifica]
MNKKPAKASLFRFVTLRNPQLLCSKERERGFVFFPKSEKSQSAFLKDVDEEEENDDVIRAAMQTKFATYAPFTRKSHVKALSEDLYEFSAWLMKNKKTITLDQFTTRAETATPLASAERVRLWDNLIYQTSQRRSDSIREAVIQMLVADNFLRKNDFLTEGVDKLINTDEELQRLACAYVVIPRNVSAREPISDITHRKADAKDNAILKSQLESHIATSKLEDYQKIYSEMEAVIKTVENDNAETFETAYITHQRAVDLAYSKATVVIDPDTKENTYPDLVLPEFNFKEVTFDKSQRFQDLTSAKTKSFINERLESGINDGYEILKSIDDEIGELTRVLLDNESQNREKTINYKGTIVKEKKASLPAGSFVGAAVSSIGKPNEVNLHFNVVTGIATTRIQEVLFEISDGKSFGTESSSYDVTHTKEGIILKSTEGFTIPEGTKEVSITATITTYNHEIGEIDVDMILPVNGTIIEEDGSRNGINFYFASAKHNPVYGIKQVGVADFRRVEQEVCCYVPGEVSHIENILAREYKERSTRNLISSETTTETTSETETESLTDTTTSERNELSSEVSQVLNEDQSKDYGASAGVRGNFGKKLSFFADGYFNGASSSSSSNSNTTSQTYAEEVTTRALERVVQKVSRKRTSRILREFEETNKHGFDNTQGTEHVTGVYRWVDKIYNNKLVNYGKRMMYEFDIPEPSRFFKQAIIEKAEAGVAPEGLPEGYILPELPEPLPAEIKDSRYIFPSNYQVLASKYNAEVNAPPVQYIKIGKSYSGGEFAEANGSRQFSYNDLEVPEGYKATYANWKFDFRRANNKNLNAQLQIANKEIRINKSSNESLGYRSTPHSGSLSVPDYIDSSIPVSVVGWDMGSFALNVTISCERTEKAYQQWKVETYNAIIEAYEIRVQEYNDALLESTIPTTPEGEDTRLEFSSALNRTLEKRELKRIAIDMMTRPHGIDTSKNNYVSNSYTRVNLSSGFENHASYVKFFEQAFDWEIMAYTFYPYYYAEESDWIDLFKESNGLDPIFQAFLQAGMSRMVVPVRPGFEEAVAYFLATGRTWMGNGLAIDSDDELYLSIAEELQSVDGEVEKEWETRVPTALTIVQADSAVLMEGGLPCYCENEERDSTILLSETILTGAQNTPEAPAEGDGGQVTF